MENLEITINFHYLERIIFDLTRKIGQELLEELLPLIDNKLKKERKKGELSNRTLY